MILLSDPRVAAVPLARSDDRLCTLDARFGPARARVRTGLADRLATAAALLPPAVRLQVVEGHRPVTRQRAIISGYAATVAQAHPDASAEEQRHLVSRFVSPVDVAPHVAGAAVDLTLADAGTGAELDLGTAIDATPEESGGRCFTDAADISPAARAHRELLASVLREAGLVNYPTEWWHWSFGDRYWALSTGAPAGLYGPVPEVDR
ncbi:M15 family metallopeptidase [uncultured Modestobacter sp.]|uniref:M15 family metallopeptidase n=1 Tax=uncultured Modestobacter sp. TaxID=380048 RepID=UPI0026131BFF|nr:M15 family metallopeptidase [uncultured Modestobacter sp.]